MTNTSNNPDPRVEAAAAAMWEQRPMMRTTDGAPRPWAEVPAWSYGARYREQARVALTAADAADPRKPRTITRVEELDALPCGSVILDADQVACQRMEPSWLWEAGGEIVPTSLIPTPAIVLHEPEAGPQPTNVDFAAGTAAALGVQLTEQQARDYISQHQQAEAEATA